MRKRMHFFAALAIFAAAFLPRYSHAKPQPEALLVIVGSETGMTDISLAMLRRTFQGEPAHAPGGHRLVPLNHELGSSERILFDRAVLGLEPDQVGRFWINRRIRDEGLPPRTLPSPDMAVRVVASYPGAITYVSADAVASGIRVLRVDGKLPNDPGYLLRGSR